jgi:hypothetical protein
MARSRNSSRNSLWPRLKRCNPQPPKFEEDLPRAQTESLAYQKVQGKGKAPMKVHGKGKDIMDLMEISEDIDDDIDWA